MRYLLGTLSKEERERFEERYFSDDAEFEEIEIAEEELIDRYVRGELPAGDAAKFEQTLARSARLRERVEFAKLFADKLRAAEAPIVTPMHKETWWQRLFGSANVGRGPQLAFAFSTLLVLVAVTIVVVGWLQLRRQSQQLAARQAALEQRQRELDNQIDQFAGQGGAIVFLTLAPGATRSLTGLSQIHILPETSEVQLALNLRTTDYPSYRATINSTNHLSVFSKSDLKPQGTKNGPVLILSIPAQSLAAGDYHLTLSGEPTNERVDDYLFRVSR